MKGSYIMNKLLSFYNLNGKSFSEKIGLERPQAIYDIQNGKTKNISVNMANKIISVFPDISRTWLLTGEGEMLKTGTVPQNTEERFDPYKVLLLPIEAVGGKLSDFVMSVKESDCEKIISPIKNIDFAITVTGDSMEPEFPNGSQVLIKKINEKAFIEWGRVYVLDTCNGTIIKEVRYCDDEKIMCHSRNPDPKYHPFPVNFSDIYGVYKVMLCMSLK